ncbi:hypothetical protein E3Q07_03761 [Wallemia mellicola]|nr:hypothetical protein E3Q07_03761 [Wallemia mellicola]
MYNLRKPDASTFPNHDGEYTICDLFNTNRIGFRYWNESPWVQYEDISAPAGRFLGGLSAFVNGIYTYSGAESVVLVSRETRIPIKEITFSDKEVLWRMIFFYIFVCSLDNAHSFMYRPPT